MHAIGPLVGHIIIVTTSGGRVRKLMLKDLHEIVKNHIFARAIHHVWHKTGLRPCQHLCINGIQRIFAYIKVPCTGLIESLLKVCYGVGLLRP